MSESAYLSARLHGLADEAFLQVEQDGLVVGEADVGVGMVDEVDGVDGHVWVDPLSKRVKRNRR